jgi:glycosyltransferase involved in cell wall biosynthesis
MRDRIAIISGVCVEHDAISNTMRDQKTLLEEAGNQVQLFAHSADRCTAEEVKVLTDPLSLAADPYYRDADLAVFHFGVHYQMFNALLLGHAPRRVVHFHNVTPPEILQGAARALSVSSLDQLSLAEYADEVWSDSAHNTDVLCANTGVRREQVHQMELRVPLADHPLPLRFAAPGEPVNVLTVGRFVEAKGTLDLVRAVSSLDATLGPVRLLLVGSTTFSDAAYMKGLCSELDCLPDHVEAVVIEGPDDQQLVELYRSAHVFATASRHEGFCLPVFEALASGCRVVATDAGALSDSVGPCGEVVPVGDVAVLANAIAEQVVAARADDEEAADALDPLCLDHLARVSTERCRVRLLAAVERVMAIPRP